MTNLNMAVGAKSQLIANNRPKVHLPIRGFFTVEAFRKGKRLFKSVVENGITVEGKNHVLDVVFGGTSANDPWYIGLISNTGSPSLSENDTLSSHAGWTEETNYSGNRQEWVDAAAASKTKGTTTASSFTLTADADIYGVFLASAATGTSGILHNTAALAAVRSLLSGDEFKASYSIQL